MSKNINVTAHAKRYEQTELQDIVALVAELNKLIDSRREFAIADYKQKLAILEAGEIPEPDPVVEKPKRKRGGKKVAETE